MSRSMICICLCVAAVFASGCCLFTPTPTPAPRPNHVVIVGLDGLAPADITPESTPNLDRMIHDGSYTWNLVVRNPHSRVAVFNEAMAPLGTNVLAECRMHGLATGAIVRSRGLATLDPRTLIAEDVSTTLNDPESVGSFAAAQWLRTRPACFFVELSAGGELPEICDRGLGKLFSAIQRSGLADRTTVIVMSANGPNFYWMIRGPETRHGHKIAAELTAGSTAGVAAQTLLAGRPGTSAGLFPAAAFRRTSREATSDDERIVPRGSIHGTLLTPNGRSMHRATVLLVNTEPVDGITERYANTDELGEFRFDSIPADTYDFLFVLDNLPAPVPHSLLVANEIEVRRDTTTTPILTYKRLQGSDSSALPVPPADETIPFLTADQITRLGRAARAGSPVPLLAADALTGRRIRTRYVQEWLVASAEHLANRLRQEVMSDDIIAEMIDSAATYDVNRPAGSLTNSNEKTVRSVLKLAAVQLLPKTGAGNYRGAQVSLALAVTAGALGGSPFSDRLLSAGEEAFERRLGDLKTLAKDDPAAITSSELSAALAYTAVNRALGGQDFADEELLRLTELAAACLTPVQRRVSPANEDAEPDASLGYLGLAKSLFAEETFGERARGLWEACGSPVWSPRNDDSVLGALLTAADKPTFHALAPASSSRLNRSTAILTRGWGTPEEWFVRVNGWSIELFARAAKIASIHTEPVAGCIESQPKIIRFKTSPAYDYVLMSCQLSDQSKSHLTAYRHVLFNKLTGYLIVSDELPTGFISDTSVAGQFEELTNNGFSLQALAMDVPESTNELFRMRNTASCPTFIVYMPPTGSDDSGILLGPWDATCTTFSDDLSGRPSGVSLDLLTDRGREFIRIARDSAHIAGNIEDRMLEGSVCIIRSGSRSTDLILIDAAWAQSDELFLKLEEGNGYATFDDSGRIDGWATSDQSHDAQLWLGENTSNRPSLTVDGEPEDIEQTRDHVEFRLPRGAHVFTIE